MPAPKGADNSRSQALASRLAQAQSDARDLNVSCLVLEQDAERCGCPGLVLERLRDLGERIDGLCDVLEGQA